MRRNAAQDRGSVAVETAIVTPVIFGFLVLGMFGARVVSAEREVQAAATAGARAASLAGPATATAEAEAAAFASVDDAGVSCAGGPSVTVTNGSTGFAPGSTVSVTVTCTVDVSDLTFIGLPGNIDFDYTATEVVDELRGEG